MFLSEESLLEHEKNVHGYLATHKAEGAMDIEQQGISNPEGEIQKNNERLPDKDDSQSRIHKCGKCGKMFLDNTKLSEHIGIFHMESMDENMDATPLKETDSRVHQERESLQDKTQTQSTIHKCKTCRRMFPNRAALENHNSSEHDTPISMYFVKIRSMWWPAESVSPSRGEIISVRIFNNEKSEVDFNTNNSKEIKPLTPLESIPRSRSKEWKAGYEKALVAYRSISQ